jgi:hypothetical protein
MREPLFEDLRDYAGSTVRPPDFADIRQRARRIRRRRAVASAAAVAVLAATGLGYAAVSQADRGSQVAVPTPTPSNAAEKGWPRTTAVAATGTDDLYVVVERCRDCGPELYASADAGATWQPRTEPPPPADAAVPRFSSIVSLGPGILAWQDGHVLTIGEAQGMSPLPDNNGPSDRLWITVDGGRTWRRAGIDPKPVATLPPGTRPVDCGLAGRDAPCLIYAVNPVTGRFAPLAGQPSGITVESGWASQTNVPPGARLWVPGLDPVTRMPALASSSDRGRTWRTHVFADGVQAVTQDGTIATMYLPTVAAGPNGTAYVLTYRDDLRKDTHRTTDGGATWKSGASVPEIPDAGFVTADGAHVVNAGGQFLAARAGRGYERVTLPGFPAVPRQYAYPVSQQVAGRYLVSPSDDLALSDDGWTWRRLTAP